MSNKDWDAPFDFDAKYGEGYDLLIRAILPGYEDLFPTTVGILSEAVPEKGLVLVVGCGTGSELKALATLQPDWQITGVDPSPSMIHTCRKKLQGHPHLTLHEGFLQSLSSDCVFDGSTAILVMHFIEGDEAKLAFLRQIRARLCPKAIHIHLDAVAHPGGKGWDTMMRSWKRISLSLGLPEARWDSLQQQIQVGLFRVNETRMEELFREAGFIEIQRFWMSLHHTGWLMRAGGLSL